MTVGVNERGQGAEALEKEWSVRQRTRENVTEGGGRERRLLRRKHGLSC